MRKGLTRARPLFVHSTLCAVQEDASLPSLFQDAVAFCVFGGVFRDELFPADPQKLCKFLDIAFGGFDRRNAAAVRALLAINLLLNARGDFLQTPFDIIMRFEMSTKAEILVPLCLSQTADLDEIGNHTTKVAHRHTPRHSSRFSILRMLMPDYDVVGVGLNATDTLILLSHFPAYAGKVAFDDEILSPGGQVASAMVTCAMLGLKVKYIGTVGDDERGRIQMESLRGSGINLDDVEVRANCANQTAYILIDRTTGERTVLWRRDDCLQLHPDGITPEKITCARLLHIDGHDTAAVARAAEIARRHNMPVTVDVDTIYHGFDQVLPHVTHLVASSEFPVQWTNERDPFKALKTIQDEFHIPVAAMTLGAHGALARTGGKFIYSPAFVVNCVDTTGAGDVFHGAFCYAVLQNMPMRECLEFSNAMAALNCTALGARGGIAPIEEANRLMQRAERRSHRDFEQRVQSRSTA